MSHIVEITIDLTSSNNKPHIQAFKVTKTGEKNIYCKGEMWGNHGRRFFIPHMNEVRYRGTLKYTYCYQTEETDYAIMAESKETADAIKSIMKSLEDDIKQYQFRLEKNKDYFGKNICGQNIKEKENDRKAIS